MPSVILAGTTTGTALSLTSDTSGELQIRTNNGATTAMTLTTAGDVGIGNTSPFANASYTSMTIGGSKRGLIELKNASNVAPGYLYVDAESHLALETGSAQAIRFATNSAERMRITSAGNVGIGTSSPNFRLQLNTPTASAAQYLQITNGSTGSAAGDGMLVGVDTSNEAIVWMQESAALKFATSNAERMRIDSSGFIGMGTSSPVSRLTLMGAAGWSSFNYGKSLYITTGGNPCIGIADSTGANNWAIGNLAGALNFSTMPAITDSTTNPTERMRIDANGQVGIGSGTTNARLWVVGTDNTSGNFSMYAANNAGTIQFGLRNDNYFLAPAIANYPTSGSTVVLNSTYIGYLSSSIRFKKDVVNYDKGLSEVEQLRPVYYRGSKPNQDGIYDERTYAGFIAEEVKELGLEEYIDYDQEGEVVSLKYGQMTALLCKAIQELKAELDSVKAELQTLKGN